MVRVFVVVGQMYQTWRRPRAHHLHPSPSRTLLGNEQTAGFLKQGRESTADVLRLAFWCKDLATQSHKTC